ncbi:MAG: hypothetical protein HYU57_00865 [Micavibrio aeruginosavorus]|nr:hypothetical protein [Micavibrio aeruginosavorus]
MKKGKNRIDKRSRQLIRLLEREHVTAQDLLRASFATRAPRGLHLREGHGDYAVPLGIINGEGDPRRFRALNRLFDQGIAGYALHSGEILLARTYGPQRDPGTNRLKPAFRSASILAHEAMHRLQFHAQKTLGDGPAMDNRFIPPVLLAPFPQSLREFGQSIKTLFNRIAMDWEYVDSRKSVPLRLLYLCGLSRLNVGRYLSQDCEVQARMHEIMSAGYAAWNKMPETPTAFYAAMANCGAKLPDSVLRQLETPEGRRALRDFAVPPALRRKIAHTVRDINRVYDYAALPQAQEKLWRLAMPALYGDMLELYGDTRGWARMGLGPPRHDMLDVLRLIMQEIEPGPAALQRQTKKVRPENAAELCSMMMTRADTPARRARVTACLEEMLKSPATRAAIIHPAPYSDYGRLSGYTPFENALRRGVDSWISMMVAAGADPFAPVESSNPVNGETYRRSPVSVLVEWDWHYYRTPGGNSRNHDLQHRLNAIDGLKALLKCPEIAPRERRARWICGQKEPVMETLESIAAPLLDPRENPLNQAFYKELEIRGHF